MPAYNKYHLKIGNFIFPLKYIRLETYKISPDQRQEFDSYVDGDGVLQRPNVAQHTRTKIEFETPHMYVWELEELLENIWANLTDELKLECDCEYYNLEKRKYVPGHFCMPATREYQYYNVEINNQTRFAFIEL